MSEKSIYNKPGLIEFFGGMFIEPKTERRDFIEIIGSIFDESRREIEHRKFLNDISVGKVRGPHEGEWDDLGNSGSGDSGGRDEGEEGMY